MAVRTDGAADMASSAFFFRETRLPRRHPPSCVTRCVDSMSFSRPESDSGLNPPNTTVNGAPMRASASIVIGSSGTIPM